MDIYKILSMLPHRYPFILVDRVIEIKPGESLKAIKNVTINEPFFPGHFPEKPIMPGVLIIESLAQACSLLALNDEKYLEIVQKGGLPLFVGIDKAKFKKPVVPGDTLILEVKPTRVRADKFYAAYDAQAAVEGDLVAKASLSMMLSPSSVTDSAD